MFDLQVTFANVSFPNVDHPQFFWKLLPEILEFAEGLIFGQTSTLLWTPYWMSHLPYSRLKADLHTLHLVNPGTVVHPQD